MTRSRGSLALKCTGLRRNYRAGRRTVTALAGASLSAPTGTVTGLVGANGAGKTTLIRCILGLSTPSGGSMQVFGRDVGRRATRGVGQIGALVETPGLIGGLSGRDNLRAVSQLVGVKDERVDELIEYCGLVDAATRSVSTYSLGMRQRLGIAIALVSDPELVILDEPTNAMDPSGIRWVRSIIDNLRADGRTVLVATHRLEEVEQSCDRIVLMHDGRTVFEDSLQELRLRTSSFVYELSTSVSDVETARALVAAGFDAKLGDHGAQVSCEESDLPQVSISLASQGIGVTSLTPRQSSLTELLEDLVKQAE